MRKLIAIAALAACGAALAGGLGYNPGTNVAYWNGFAERVQTITGQIALRCGYVFNARTFYKLFKLDQCPTEIEVE